MLRPVLLVTLSLLVLSCDSMPEAGTAPHERLVGTWVLVRVVEHGPDGVRTRTQAFERQVGGLTLRFDALIGPQGGRYRLDVDAPFGPARQIAGEYLPKTIRGEGNWVVQLTGPNGRAPYVNPGFAFDGADALVLTISDPLAAWADLDFAFDGRLEWHFLRK